MNWIAIISNPRSAKKRSYPPRQGKQRSRSNYRIFLSNQNPLQRLRHKTWVQLKTFKNSIQSDHPDIDMRSYSSVRGVRNPKIFEDSFWICIRNLEFLFEKIFDGPNSNLKKKIWKKSNWIWMLIHPIRKYPNPKI